jgi:hypothetical protein
MTSVWGCAQVVTQDLADLLTASMCISRLWVQRAGHTVFAACDMSFDWILCQDP